MTSGFRGRVRTGLLNAAWRRSPRGLFVFKSDSLFSFSFRHPSRGPHRRRRRRPTTRCCGRCSRRHGLRSPAARRSTHLNRGGDRNRIIFAINNRSRAHGESLFLSDRRPTDIGHHCYYVSVSSSVFLNISDGSVVFRRPVPTRGAPRSPSPAARISPPRVSPRTRTVMYYMFFIGTTIFFLIFILRKYEKK